MAIIKLSTEIKAPIERCFDLSRSVDLHLISTGKTNERAIAGVTKGLMGHKQNVTWRAKHLGVYQNMTVEISEYNSPTYFKTKMLKGTFASMEHEHIFESHNGKTIMKDIFIFHAPLGILGKLAEGFFLRNYMRFFLVQRNKVIKQVAESEDWRKILLKDAIGQG